MAIFDFISGDEFRTSLEADYHELNLSMEVGAWKAVHILAGSIIEAILIDYLAAAAYKKLPNTDILKMDLYQAISACRAEGILSERTEHLSHAIRSYRNLIHPGRLVRLNETANQNGAKISQALVEIIAEEVAAKKRDKFGWTGEQIVTKIEQDPASIANLEHMLKNTTNSELERLLIKILPKRYFDLMNSEEPHNDLTLVFETCFRRAFSFVPVEIKKKVTIRFARIVGEEVTDMTWMYAFFRGSDLEYLSEVDAELIKKHLISSLVDNTSISIRTWNGIGKFLNVDETRDFTFVCIIDMLKYRLDKSTIEGFKIALENEYRAMDKQNQETTIRILNSLKEGFKTENRLEGFGLVDEMLELLTLRPHLS